jgi:hypothetical protein
LQKLRFELRGSASCRFMIVRHPSSS